MFLKKQDSFREFLHSMQTKETQKSRYPQIHLIAGALFHNTTARLHPSLFTVHVFRWCCLSDSSARQTRPANTAPESKEKTDGAGPDASTTSPCNCNTTCSDQVGPADEPIFFPNFLFGWTIIKTMSRFCLGALPPTPGCLPSKPS